MGDATIRGTFPSPKLSTMQHFILGWQGSSSDLFLVLMHLKTPFLVLV